jgi:hypothetical protein
VINYWDGEGPLLPEGTEEFIPGAFNRNYALKQAELAVHDAEVQLKAAQRTLRRERERA